MKFIVLILALLPFSLISLPTEAQRKQYADQINTAFELQSKGHTRKAYYVFKDAYQSALKSGMSYSVLSPLEELFVWYRKYGYSCGLTKVPANCAGEYKPYDYDNEEYDVPPHTPQQEKLMGDFLCGIGCVVGGVFSITVKGPVGLTVGSSLVLSGLGYMYTAVMEMVMESKEQKLRLSELEEIKQEILAAMEKK